MTRPRTHEEWVRDQISGLVGDYVALESIVARASGHGPGGNGTGLPAAVVQPEVPVAVGPVRALGGSRAQGDRQHAGDPYRPLGDQLGEPLVVDDHTASTAAATSPHTHTAVTCPRPGRAATISSVAGVASGRLLDCVVAAARPACRPPLRLLAKEAQ
jgi:hypothetical protein